MGNSHSKSEAKPNKVEIEKLPVFDTTILIDRKIPDAKIQLSQLLLFPDGWDGLKVWEAGIALSRFIFRNRSLFQGKRVLELGTGVGIAGLAAALFGEASLVHFTDYRPEIVTNALKNIQKNASLLQRKGRSPPVCESFVLDWTKSKGFEEKYDLIIGSDLVYMGAPIADLSNLIGRALREQGSFYLLIPSDRMATKSFVDCMESTGMFSHKVIDLRDSWYYESPLEDEEEGFKVYLGMKKLKFFVHVFEKKTKG